jgi:hypothetical protein
VGGPSLFGINTNTLISGDRVDNPVMFPPGCAKLATKPLPTGSLSAAMMMGIVTVAFLAGQVDNDVHVEIHQLDCERWKAIELSLLVSILNDDVCCRS